MRKERRGKDRREERRSFIILTSATGGGEDGPLVFCFDETVNEAVEETVYCITLLHSCFLIIIPIR